MSVEGGASAFERLRTHLEDVTRTCPDCGYEDDGEWVVEPAGSDFAYRHVCPCCGAESVRRLRIE